LSACLVAAALCHTQRISFIDCLNRTVANRLPARLPTWLHNTSQIVQVTLDTGEIYVHAFRVGPSLLSLMSSSRSLTHALSKHLELHESSRFLSPMWMQVW